jgi:hypothetical protein
MPGNFPNAGPARWRDVIGMNRAGGAGGLEPVQFHAPKMGSFRYRNNNPDD